MDIGFQFETRMQIGPQVDFCFDGVFVWEKLWSVPFCSPLLLLVWRFSSRIEAEISLIRLSNFRGTTSPAPLRQTGKLFLLPGKQDQGNKYERYVAGVFDAVRILIVD